MAAGLSEACSIHWWIASQQCCVPEGLNELSVEQAEEKASQSRAHPVRNGDGLHKAYDSARIS